MGPTARHHADPTARHSDTELARSDMKRSHEKLRPEERGDGRGNLWGRGDNTPRVGGTDRAALLGTLRKGAAPLVAMERLKARETVQGRG